MEKRCIFCMEEAVNEQGTCDACGKSQWEYIWNRRYLAPYVRLQDKYILGSVLGAGGFGVTYIGFDTVLRHKVAIKELFPQHLASREPDGFTVSVAENASEHFALQKQTFREESALLSGSLGTPGICNVIDFFEENQTAYIVEEYLPGQTLAQYLSRQPGHKISWERCRELFIPVLSGLCHVHSLGIVHCDISPDNLMFDGDGALKLIDFGSARQAAGGKMSRNPAADNPASVHSGRNNTEYSESKMFKETYAAPEQYGDGRMIGPWTDLYSVCAVMYLALTGEKPVPSLTRLRHGKLPAISVYNTIPQEAESAVLQGMDPDIRRRYFYTGILMERLGIDAREAKLLTGRFRNKWGDVWLEIFTQGSFSSAPKGLLSRIRRWFTKDRLKRLLSGIAVAAGACLFLALGLLLYVKTHPVQLLRFRARQEQAQAARLWKQSDAQNPFLIYPETARYEELLELLSHYEHEYDKVREETNYIVPSPFLVQQNLISGNYHEFPLKLSLTEQIIGYYLAQDIEAYSTDGSCIVCVAAGQPLDVYGFVENEYSYRTKSNAFEKLRISYDAASLQVSELEVDGYQEDITIFLRDIFPWLVPETYLTSEETKELFARMKADPDGNARIRSHSRFTLSLQQDSSDDMLIRLYLKSDPAF